MQHADGRRVNRQAVHEVGGAVQRVQHPEKIGGRPVVAVRRKRIVLLAQDAVGWEPPGDLFHQVGLGLLVGGGDGVLLGFVLVLHADNVAEMAGQQRAGALGELHGGGFDGGSIHNIDGNTHNGWIVHHLSGLKCGDEPSVIASAAWQSRRREGHRCISGIAIRLRRTALLAMTNGQVSTCYNRRHHSREAGQWIWN